MKILHVINNLATGGAERHLFTLCCHLKRQGIEVLVAYLKVHDRDNAALVPDFEANGIRTVNLRASAHYDARVIPRLVQLVRKEKPDILHTHLPRADFAGAIGRWFCPSLPWVCSIHGIYSESWSGRSALPLFNWVWRRADAVVAISDAVRNWLVSARRVPADKVSTIYYGIEPEHFGCAPVNPKNERDLKRRVFVGSLGRLEPGKGHDRLIRSMPFVVQQVPNIALLIGGHDVWGYGGTLRALIDDLGLNHCVRLVGFQRDVPAFFGGLDVFALATRSEGFGQVLVEAMAAGKPVVAARIPPMTEIVVDGDTGILVEPDNPEAFGRAISWLLLHPDEAGKMGDRGRERVRRNFSAVSMTARMIALYRHVVGWQDGVQEAVLS
jgi:glycosyltransferase involved in cell wall biosynthesis